MTFSEGGYFGSNPNNGYFGGPQTLNSLPDVKAAIYGVGGKSGASVGAPCVATRCVTGHYGQQGTDTSGTCRTFHRLTENVASIKICYANFSTTGAAGDADNGNPLYLKAAIEYPAGTGILRKVFFREGLRVCQLDDGGRIVSDSIALPGIAGTGLYVYTYVSVLGIWTVTGGTNTGGTFTLTFGAQTTGGIAWNATAATVQAAIVALSSVLGGNVEVTGVAPNWIIRFQGTLYQSAGALTGSGASLTGGSGFAIAQGQWPQGLTTCGVVSAQSTAWPNGEGYTASLDQTDLGTTTLANAHVFGPAAILGEAYNGRIACWGLLGDSIMQGKGDQSPIIYGSTGGLDQGYGVRAMHADPAYPVAYINIAQSAEKAINFQDAGHRYRMSLLANCSAALFEYATNDVNTGTNFVSIQFAVNQIFKELQQLGIPFYIATLIPRYSATTDGFQVLANQTLGANDSVRQAYNTWVRGNWQALGAAGIVDTAALIEVNASNVVTLNGGFWQQATTLATGTSTTATGNTITDATLSPFLPSMVGKLIYITSSKDVGVIGAVNSTSQLTISLVYTQVSGYGSNQTTWTANPTANAYTIYDGPTADGVHPTTTMVTRMATAMPVLRPAYVKSPLYNNLSAFWSCSEFSGNRFDWSGNGLDLVTPGGAAEPTQAAGRIGPSLLFTGANSQFLSTPDTALLRSNGGPFTVTGWMHMQAVTPTSSYTICCKWNTGAGVAKEFLFRWTNGNGGRFELQVSDNTNTTIAFQAPTVFSNTSWYFVAGGYDPTGIIYGTPGTPTVWIQVNAQTAFTIADVGGAGAVATTQAFNVGRRLNNSAGTDYAGNPAATCKLDAIGFWLRCLLPSETTQLYNFGNGLQPPFIPV